ncbi:hypothetical protein JCM10213_001707 [Rhodosporidiobolus nylandii]
MADNARMSSLPNANSASPPPLPRASRSRSPPPLDQKPPGGRMHPPPPFQPRPSYLRGAPSARGEAKGRNIALFFDGTGNVFGEHITNIPTLFSLVSEDPSKQLNYYQTGIGTTISTHEHFLSPAKMWEKVGQALDAGVAWSLADHICKGYAFLMNYWQPGDQIYLFGFSRGAFTARALAGMLQQVGLLPAGNEETIPLAWSIYKKTSVQLTPTETLAAGFKRSFSREVRVHFVGVFDTVSSVGALYPRTLPFASGTNYISAFRHALSLDERRARYAEQVWIAEPPAPDASEDDHAPTTVKEVWFAGAHSNVGGGEFPYDGDATPSLSHLPLRWLLREAVEQGLELDSARVAASPIFAPFWDEARRALDAGETADPHLLAYLTAVRSANPDVNAQVSACVFLSARPSAVATADALAPRANHVSLEIEKRPATVRRKMGVWARMRDWASRLSQRAVTLGWWVLEVSPTLKVLWDAEGNTRRTTLRANFGRGRLLPPSPSFHFSVRERLAAGPSKAGGDGHAFGEGNNQNFPEGEHYHFAARFRKGEGIEGVRWVE